MGKFLFVLFSVFLLSACATVSEDHDPQADTQTASTADSELGQVETRMAMPVETEGHDAAAATKKILSKQEIKSMQAQLRAVGFYPGPVDGVLGAKTMSALQRLQSVCASLKDLLENPPSGTSARSQGVEGTADEIRLIQVRLRDAGFDVGAVDGVMGSKTRSALIRAQSGCTAVKDAPVTLESQAQPSDRMTSPIRGSGKQLQLQPAKALNAESMNDETDSANAAMNKSSSREDVRLLQSQLKAAGFDPGPLDGVLGVKTKSALEQYQKVYGAAPLRKVSTDAGPKSDY